jgi:hypothetical protein
MRAFNHNLRGATIILRKKADSLQLYPELWAGHDRYQAKIMIHLGAGLTPGRLVVERAKNQAGTRPG